jgi:hypothetical protein
MSEQPLETRLRALMEARGVDLSIEEGQTILRWLVREVTEQAPADWEARLPEAARLAGAVYWDFMTAYNAFYEEPDGKGPAHVIRALRGRSGEADPLVVEAVLDRIRNRRLHLLDGFRRKYQPSLFAARAVDARKIRGYLVRVANLESLHVSAGDSPWNLGRGINLAALAEPAAPTPEPESVDPRRLAESLRAFWARDNGFTAEMRLEGLTSLGLGFLAGIPEVDERCRDLLAQKLPAWERETTHLRQRISRWLARLEETQREASIARTPTERERAIERQSRIEERLARLRVRLARQPARLRPRAGEVQVALAEYVASVGNTRFRRVTREIALFENRVRTGGRALLESVAEQGTTEVSQLVADVERHLSSAPVSPRAHGLSAQERAERQRQYVAWRAQGADLLGRVRGHNRLVFNFPHAAPVNQVVLNWLADTEDLYEFGLLRRNGVFAGLGRRHGWRLEHLLRRS